MTLLPHYAYTKYTVAKKGKKKINFKLTKNTLFLSLAVLSAIVVSLTIFLVSQKSDNNKYSYAQAKSGWLSGASCKVTDGGFANWRGSPVTIAGTWNDASLEGQRQQWSLANEYGGWTESIDASIGGFWGPTWTDVANGAIDDNLHTALTEIDKGWGNKKTIFIRFAHEFNGSWYKWKVKPEDNESFKKAFARFYNMVQTDLVAKGRDAKVVWSPNSDEHNGVNTKDSWPGDQYVDVVGVDYYDWDRATDQAKWDEVFNKTGKSGGPAGIGAWQAFAKSHGKPIAFPEWGTTGDGPYDNPFFIQKMNEFFRANAGTGPGQVWYEIYFDCTGYDNGGGENFLIYPEAQSKVPKSAAMYKSLKWGDGGIVGTNPAITAGTSPIVTAIPTEIIPTYECIGGTNCGPSPTPNIEVPYDNNTVTPEMRQPISQPENGNNGGGNRSGGGFFQSFFSLLFAFLAFLLNLIGSR